MEGSKSVGMFVEKQTDNIYSEILIIDLTINCEL